MATILLLTVFGNKHVFAAAPIALVVKHSVPTRQAGPVAEAQSLFSQGQIPQAARTLSPWLLANPEDSVALKLMGKIHFTHAEQLRSKRSANSQLQQAYGRAKTTLERALKAGAQGVSIHHALAYCHKIRGEYQAGIEQCTLALASNVKNPTLLTLRAQCLTALGNTSEAKADLIGATTNAPSTSQSHILLAQLMNTHGERKQALVLMWDFYHRLPKKVDIRHVKALTLIYQIGLTANDVELTIPALQILVASDPTNSIAHVELAMGYYRKGLFAKSQALLAPVLSGKLKASGIALGSAYHYAALLEKHSGQFAEAIRYFEMALGQVPNDSRSLQNLAACYRKLGDSAKARKLLAQLKRVAPFNDTLRTARRNVLRNARNVSARVQLIHSLLNLERYVDAGQEIRKFESIMPGHSVLPMLKLAHKQRSSQKNSGR